MSRAKASVFRHALPRHTDPGRKPAKRFTDQRFGSGCRRIGRLQGWHEDVRELHGDIAYFHLERNNDRERTFVSLSNFLATCVENQ